MGGEKKKEEGVSNHNNLVSTHTETGLTSLQLTHVIHMASGHICFLKDSLISVPILKKIQINCALMDGHYGYNHLSFNNILEKKIYIYIYYLNIVTYI